MENTDDMKDTVFNAFGSLQVLEEVALFLF